MVQLNEVSAPEITVKRVAGRIGAEVSGIDLSADLDDATVARLRQELLTHRVLFFHGPDIGHERHIAFGRRFGDLTRRPGKQHGIAPDGFPEILSVDRNAEHERYGKDYEERFRRKWVSALAGWHSDLTPAVNPPAASILRAERTPPYGGDTQWTNMVAAYEGLSKPIRDFVDTLRAEHAFFTGVQLLHTDPDDRHILQMYCDLPQAAIHPVVRVHPETGERALFVSPGSTTRIMGLSQVESKRVLDLLYEHITSAEYTVRFRWEPGSIAFWDNRSTCHFAPTDFAHYDNERVMHRVTLLGDTPVGVDGTPSELVAGEPMIAW
ncbi:TauD/TfdA dioxygenase family protein [Actinokineospora sp. HUAS TT18]|uniref:TauD/TfdA dioxygenase family protein n=1 Tax=Actinokineospora sp. HUAS TT18 TaxID=3447451 RepID=UPI003F520E85